MQNSIYLWDKFSRGISGLVVNPRVIGGFSPAVLFANNEPGVWYDPSQAANLDWRRNLLVQTETGTGWVPDATTLSTGLPGVPGETESSFSFTRSAGTSYIREGIYNTPSGVQVTCSAWVSISDGAAVAVRPAAFYNGVWNLLGAGDLTLTTTPQKFTWTYTPTTATSFGTGFALRCVYTSPGGSVIVSGAQLELGSTATEYQRISDVNTEVRERFPQATLFQDTAGTTPVTTPGQTVGLMLDKSKGLTLGPELVTNGDFSNGATGWTNFQDVGVHTWDYSAGVLVFSRGSTGGAGALQSFSVSPNTNYILSGDVVSVTGDGTTANFAVWNGGVFPTALISNVIRESGTTGSLIFNSGANTSVNLYVQCARSTTITVDNISVKELPGFHATQSNTSWQPQYGIVPKTGRRNLLGRTEEFDNVYWVKRRGTISADGVLAPNGTMTADTFVEDTATGVHDFYNGSGVSVQAGDHTASVYIKPRGRTFVRLIFATGGSSAGAYFDLTTGDTFGVTAGYTASAVLDASGFWRLSLTATFAATTLFFAVTSAEGSNPNLVGLNAAAFDVWGAQLEVGSTATAYQRVSTALDVTEAGVTSLGYLYFDGVDDFMVTPTITPGTDKVQVFAGVRKLSDAAFGIVVETSTNIVLGNGRIVLFGNQGVGYTWQTKGTSTAGTNANSIGAAPITSVLGAIGDIASDTAVIRVNGAQVATSASDQGTGDYLAQPMYIGSRGGTSVFFKGDFYQLLTRFGSNLSTPTIEAVEAQIGNLTPENI